MEVLQGLLDKQLSNMACARSKFVWLDLVVRQHGWALARWASESEKSLTLQENLHVFVLHNQKAIYLSPVLALF